MMIQTFVAATRRKGAYFFFAICVSRSTSTSTAPISSSTDSSSNSCTGSGSGSGSGSSASSLPRRGRISDLTSGKSSDSSSETTSSDSTSTSSRSSSGRRRRSSDASSVSSSISSSSSSPSPSPSSISNTTSSSSGRRRISDPSRSDSSSSLGERSSDSNSSSGRRRRRSRSPDSSSSSGGSSSNNSDSSSSSGSNSQSLHRLALLGFSDACSQARFSSLPLLSADVPDKLHLFLSSGSSPAQITRRFANSKHMNLLSTIPLAKLSAYIDLLGPYPILLRPDILFRGIPNLRSKLHFLQNFGLSLERIQHYPRLFSLHVGTLNARLSFLKSLGLDLPKCVGRFPYLLCADPVKRIQPTIDFLEKERGLSRKTICKLATIRPQILTLSRQYLASKIEFFESIGLDVNSSQFYPCIVRLCSFNDILIRSRFDWLTSRGLSREGVIRILERAPLVFSLREDNVGEKIDYLLNVLNRNVQEVLHNTSFLTMSLEKRIKPRFSVLAQLQEKGLVDDFSLSVFITSNEAFKERFINLLQAEGTQQKVKVRIYGRKRDKTIEANKEFAPPRPSPNRI